MIKKKRTCLLLFNITLLLIFVLQLLFHFLIFPKIAITKIRFESDLNAAEEDILKLIGISNPQSYYNINPLAIEEKIKQYPIVQSVEVKKQFPNLLSVQLKKRQPALAVIVASQIRNIPFLVDQEGLIFSMGLGEYDNLPILSGLQFNNSDPLRNTLPKVLLPLIRSLARLKELDPGLYNLISEIRTSVESASLKLDVYLNHYQTYIKMNETIGRHTLQTALIALDVLKRSREKSEFIDMRTTGIIYRKEGGGVQLPKAEDTL